MRFLFIAVCCVLFGCGSDDMGHATPGFLQVVDPEGTREGSCVFLTDRHDGGTNVDFNTVTLDRSENVEQTKCVLFAVLAHDRPYWISGPKVKVDFDGEPVARSVRELDMPIAEGLLMFHVVDGSSLAETELASGVVEVREVAIDHVAVAVRVE